MLTFISYSRPSRDLVRTLAKDLEGIGHAVWFDQDLSGGQAWWDTILGKIRACDVFVFGLAPDSLDSQACRIESSYAAKLNKRILPVLLTDGVSMNLLPADLSSIQYVDYRRQDRTVIFALLKAINDLPAPRSVPDPLPEPPPAPLSYLGDLKDQIGAPAPLSFEQQTALVLKLKERLHDAETGDDARALLLALRRRDDLFAKVATEIDSVLGEARAARPSVVSPPPIQRTADIVPPSPPPSAPPPAAPRPRWRAVLRWLLAVDEFIEQSEIRHRVWSRFRAEPSVRTALLWLFGEPRLYYLFGRMAAKLLLVLMLIGFVVRLIAAVATA